LVQPPKSFGSNAEGLWFKRRRALVQTPKGFGSNAEGLWFKRRRALVQTPKALTNSSPGLEQPWVENQRKNNNAESVG
jgi:hypothetical protein